MAPGTFFHTRCNESRRALAREGSRRAFPVLALLAVLLLAAPGAFAAQERVAPDALAADGCDWSNCTIAAVDDNPDSPDADWAAATGDNTNHFGHFGFATPSQSLTSGADLQVFRAAVRKSAVGCGTGTPTARIELWEAGASVRAGTAVSVTSASGQVISFTWNATEISNAADVEVKVFGIKSGGSPEARCAVDLGAVEWNAEVSAGGSVPTLSSPTAPFATIDTTSATLGATIDTQGSSTITDYGTVWGLSPSPTGNVQSVGATPPGPPHTFDDGGRIISPPETPGTRIYYAGYATNGTGTGYSTDGAFYLEPNQATGASISNVTSSGMRVSWTLPGTGAGNGTIVLMQEGGAVNADPADGTLYTASTSWIAPGSEIGTGNYVVFQGSGTQVDVTDLTPSTAYFVRVYQYAGTTEPLVNYEFDTAPTATDTTSAGGSVPTLSSPTAPFATISTTSATLGATIDTEGSSTITDYGTVWDTTPSPTVLTGNVQSVGATPPGPPHTFDDGGRIISPPETPGTRIYYAGYATNGTGTGYSTDGAFYLEPNQATGASISNVTSSGMRVSWTLPGTGAGDGTIVVMREGGAVNADPTDGTLYSASTTFAVGSDLGGSNYVVFQGSGTQVDVTGLTPSTAYFVRVYQYAGTTEPLVNYEFDTAPTASDTTSAGGALPTLSLPTVSAIGATSATLGARIDTEGGSTITDYGTVWGTSPSPTGNVQSVGATPPGPPHTFDDGGRTGLPQASLIYHAGYATNGAGTGYSADGSFYTDPQSQASLVRFKAALDNELTVYWSAGSGEGVIVLMRLGTAVDADPVDGVEYLDGGNVFAAGSEIGTGNYVVYVGAALEVTITGLASDLTYHVAVYEYAGSSSLINYLQASPARGRSGHNAAHGIECSECHFLTGDLHGKFGVPRDTEQETTCKSCHNDTGDASGKIDIAIHIGTNYNVSVDCGSCHEVHNNFDFTTTDAHSGGVTAANVEWIRPNTTKYISGALEPALFQANTGFFAWDDANEPWNGLCQNCHTGTDRHTNDNSMAHSHEVSNNCMGCHPHLEGFRGSGGDCTGCHSQQKEILASPGNFRRQVTESTPGAGDGEFSTDFTSHHVNDGSGSEIVTKWDCVVCHAEGNALTGDTDGTYHQKDGVQLKDVDTGAVYSNWAGLAAWQRSDFCLSCHDSDGATSITARTDPDPDATTAALNPFNDGLSNAHEPTGLDGTAAPHSRGAVLDVAGQFDTANASHHAVLGPAYVFEADCLDFQDPHSCCTAAGTGPTCDLPFGSTVDDQIQGVRTDLGWNSELDCEDCHTGPPDPKGAVAVSGHGTPTARYMLRDQDGNEAASAEPGSTSICFRCHSPDDTTGVFTDHVGTTQHTQDSFNIFGIYCLSCHGGGEWGGIHGVDASVTDDDGGVGSPYNPNVFTYGSALDLISNWSNWDARGVSCSTLAASTALNNCTQHSSKDWDRNPAREPTIIRRTYRAP